MRRWLFSLTVVVALLGLSACAAQEEAKPAPPAPAGPAAAPAARPAWQEEWERVLAAAKREGTVAVIGPVGAALRRALTEPFTTKYGITVEFLAASGAEWLPRLRAERAAGQYLWDIYIGGTSTNLFDLKPMGALDPLEPTLILPEVKEPQNWLGGAFPFVDKDRTAFTMTLGSSAALGINSNLVKAEEFKSYKDLLDPKWKGKIVMFDPRIPGSGQATLTFYYQSKDLGPDFIRALARQEPALTRDYRQQMEWLAVGRYPIAIPPHGPIAREMQEAGAPIKQVGSAQMKEGGHMASGIGTLSAMNKATHPNAAKVYINWLLTREAQTEWSRAADRASTRLDAPTNHLEPWELPNPAYFNLDTEAGRNLERNSVRPFASEVFGER